MTVRVPMSPPVLEWAVERTQLPINELEKKPDFRSLRSWLIGESTPTFRQAQKLAKLAGIPFGYLLLEKPVQRTPRLPDFRTHGSTPLSGCSPALEQTIYACERRLEWYAEDALANGITGPSFIGRFSTDTPAQKAADWSSTLLNWTPGKHERNRSRVATLADAIERAGILVMRSSIVGNNTHHKLDPDEFRGFTLIRNSYGLIFINTSDSGVGKLFSLAHEFGHVLLGEQGVSGGSLNQRAVERWCNQFAAEFLVSAKDLLTKWAETKDLEAVCHWAYKTFGVSRDVTVWLLVGNGALPEKLVSASSKKPHAQGQRNSLAVVTSLLAYAPVWAGSFSKRSLERSLKAELVNAKHPVSLVSKKSALLRLWWIATRGCHDALPN